MTARGTNPPLAGPDLAPDAGTVRHAREGNPYSCLASAAPGEKAVSPTNTNSSVADQLLAQLSVEGVDYLFMTPGTDTAPIQEAVASASRRGRVTPQVVLCAHEAVALSAAHAYFDITGRAQVVMVHVDVGTQNLGAMLHDAYRDEAGVVIIAGRTPVTADGELPGGKDNPVHWQQDVPDQPGIVRGYTKLQIDLDTPATVGRQILRAFHVANAQPCGPVYVTAYRELLMSESVESPGLDSARLRARPRPQALTAEALDEACRMLAAARRPVIVTTRIGRDSGAVAWLVKLAELIGAAVVDKRERVNFPSSHPAYVTSAEIRSVVEQADCILLADCVVPWVPNDYEPASDTRVISLDPDPVKQPIRSWSFPLDLSLKATPRVALEQIVMALVESGHGAPDALWHRDRSVASALRAATMTETLSACEVARALNEVLDGSDIVVEEATTNGAALRDNLIRDIPGTLFHPGGSGLGWPLGAAIGTRLASAGHRVIAVMGDGSFVFANPVAALMTAASARTPFLTVVLDNGGYAASARPVYQLYPQGESAQRRSVVATEFRANVDFAEIARACGAFGACVRSADELKQVLRDGLRAVDEGRLAVVVVDVESRWVRQATP